MRGEAGGVEFGEEVFDIKHRTTVLVRATGCEDEDVWRRLHVNESVPVLAIEPAESPARQQHEHGVLPRVPEPVLTALMVDWQAVNRDVASVLEWGLAILTKAYDVHSPEEPAQRRDLDLDTRAATQNLMHHERRILLDPRGTRLLGAVRLPVRLDANAVR
jgi:hypothetical protein